MAFVNNAHSLYVSLVKLPLQFAIGALKVMELLIMHVWAAIWALQIVMEMLMAVKNALLNFTIMKPHILVNLA
mgnify:CR=1 FL=1